MSSPLSIIQYGAGPMDAYILLGFWFAALVFSFLSSSVHKEAYSDQDKYNTQGWFNLGFEMSTLFTIFFLLRFLKTY